MKLAAAAIGALLVSPAILSAEIITIPNFSSPAGMTLLHSATITAGRLRLTTNAQNQWGQAWFDQLQPVAGGFLVDFDFQLDGGDASWGVGDGIAFVIQNDPNGTSAYGSNAGGGSVGYSGWPYDPSAGLQNSLAIEISPMYGGAVFVQSCGTGFNLSHQFQLMTGGNCELGTFAASFLSDRAVHHADVSYDGAFLSISLDSPGPGLTIPLYLHTLLNLQGGSSAYVGFTAGSGGAFENADILSFSMKDGSDVPEPASASLLLLGAGMGALSLAARRNRRA